MSSEFLYARHCCSIRTTAVDSHALVETMTSPEPDHHDNATERSTFSYRFAAFQLPEATNDLGVDDRDRTFTAAAAATLGAIEANLIWLVMIVLHFLSSGQIEQSHGLVGSLVRGLFVVLIGIIVSVAPFGVIGALTGISLNLFLNRSKWWFHAMSVAMFTIMFSVIVDAFAGLD